MANIFFDLPLPVLNGPGAAVDVSAQGGEKTIIVDGTFTGATITVEASVDGGVTYGTVVILQSGSSERTIELAAQYMRLNVSGRKTTVPFSADVDVGADNSGATFAVLPMPAGNGPGTTVAVSTLESLYTFVVGGAMVGAAVTIEVSDDTDNWAPIVQFSGLGGLQSKTLTAAYMRVNVSGRKATVPFSATTSLGSAAGGGGGGGSSGSPYRFTYTCLIGDGSDFVVTLPVARANDNYVVLGDQSTVTAIFAMSFPDGLAGDRTTTTFRVITTASVTAGDTIDFAVWERS